MLSENPVFGLVDLGRERSGTASVGVDLLHQAAVGRADFRFAGARLKPQELIRFLRIHTARSRRRTFPRALVTLNVVAPSGVRTGLEIDQARATTSPSTAGRGKNRARSHLS